MVLVLDKMYCCRTCRESFLFESDKDDHIKQTSHLDFETHNLAGSVI
jgi:hypothetical protein